MEKKPPFMTQPERHCLGLNCPERFSLCCGAGSVEGTVVAGTTPCFLCSKCRRYFQGGKCSAGFSGNQTYTLQQLQDLLPDYIDSQYPKSNPDRGKATVAITLYTIWLRKFIVDNDKIQFTTSKNDNYANIPVTLSCINGKIIRGHSWTHSSDTKLSDGTLCDCGQSKYVCPKLELKNEI